jgi:hypothetical protein
MAGQYANQSLDVVDKAASYTVRPGDIGKVLVATAAATFTLPAIADVWNGWNVTIFNGADTEIVVSAPSGKLVTFNNIAATSLTTTASEHVGFAVRIIYDLALTKYLALLMTEETQTVTVG